MYRTLASIVAALVALLTPALALAAPAAAAAATKEPNWAIAIGMALAIGLAAHGGGIGQGKAVSAALEGICRNPSAAQKVFTPMLLGLAFIESLVIFALVIAFMLSGSMYGQ
jgi:F-type H+-transporting ATPase subunit c